MLCDKAYRLRCKSNVVHPVFLELILNAPQIVDAVNKLKTGISDSGVNLTQKGFGELLIPLPPLAEQQRIVAEVERRLSVVEELETVVTSQPSARCTPPPGDFKICVSGRVVMSIEVKTYVNVKVKAASLHCRIPNDVAVLPINFSTAHDRKDLVYLPIATSLRKFLSTSGINETALRAKMDENPQVRFARKCVCRMGFANNIRFSYAAII